MTATIAELFFSDRDDRSDRSDRSDHMEINLTKKVSDPYDYKFP